MRPDLRHQFVCAFLYLGMLFLSPNGADAAQVDGDQFFKSKIRPLLFVNCRGCHGEKKQEGGLRVDSRAALLKGGERGPAVVPSKPQQSLLIRAVSRGDHDLEMPPDEPLNKSAVLALTHWVKNGAPWPENDATSATTAPLDRVAEIRQSHWAFRPIRNTVLPDVRNTSWVQSPIDQFVLAKLESAGLSPSPRADRRTLIRRASLDLIGLPPAWEQVRSFLQDESPNAFANLIDELLSRPEYGEHWGRHWLDVARYADTKGYVDAGERKYPFAWTYRDWVVRSFNRDLPYDRFVTAQIAADLRPLNDRWDLAALGFLTVGQRYNFFPHEIIDDRIDVVTRGLMGLTVGCARCHDHKYDPIGATDYYALYGVFANSYEPTPDEMPIISEPDAAVDTDKTFHQELREKAGALKDRRQKLHAQIQHEMRAWASDYFAYIVETMPQHRTQAQPPLRTERGVLREKSAYARGAVARWRQFLEERTDDDPVFAVWSQLVKLDREQISQQVSQVLDVGTGRINPIVEQAFHRNQPATMRDVARVYGKLLEDTEQLWREQLTHNPAAHGFDDSPREQLRQVLYGRNAPPVMTLDESEDFYQLDESTDVRKRFADIERVFLSVKNVSPRAMSMADRSNLMEQYVFVRGNPMRRGQRVERRFIQLLSEDDSEPFRKGSGRSELAAAIVSPKNPLTARVLVNRVWGWHFGRGLVTTPSDFGIRSSPPSHPELLDYLARRFLDEGRSLKDLHRWILRSNAWQQITDDRPECRQVDPENRLLWKMNRRRLEFESMRDSMLAVSGRLTPAGGGPPVERSPDDPAGTHRTIYGLLDRELLPGLFRVFDFPSPDISSPQRSRTTVPQQALFLLNNPFVMAQADALADELNLTLGPTDTNGRIRYLFRRILSRDPAPDEIRSVVRLAVRSESTISEEMPDSTPALPWTELAQVLLISNEFLFAD